MTTSQRRKNKKNSWYGTNFDLLSFLVADLVQRSILEADQEEENEEAGDMNDDELNELIARSEEEGVIFREIDAKREREVAENWRSGGNRGRPPLPLMQLEELPECYQSEEPFENKETEEMPEGRGARRRNIVSYNDGLSDDAWAMVCPRIVDE